MELPKQKIKIDKRNPSILCIYGSPKVGKTGALAELENNLIIDLEKGSSQIEALKIQANNFDELQKIGAAIVKDGYPYDYVTIDTVTELETWCEALATQLYKNTPQGANFTGMTVLELPHGAGYYWLRMAYSSWIKRLKTLAPTVILVAHVRDKNLTKKGKEVSAKDLDLTGKIRNITSKDSDAIGYIYRDPENTNNTRITFIHADELLCGARNQHLRGQDFVLTESEDGVITKSHWDKIFID